MKQHLVPNWRKAWRMWSVRLNALGAVIVAAVTASPDVLLAVSAYLPPRLALGLLGLLFVAPAIARLVKQKKLEKPDAARAPRYPDY